VFFIDTLCIYESSADITIQPTNMYSCQVFGVAIFLALY